LGGYSILVVLPIVSLMNAFLLPVVSGGANWTGLAQQTIWITMPFIVILIFNQLIATYFIILGKSKYFIIQTLASTFLWNLPILILYLSGVINATYDLSMWSFNIGITISFITTVSTKIYLYKIQRKEGI
jgi:Na+-driven multidrug efflux pump